MFFIIPLFFSITAFSQIITGTGNFSGKPSVNEVTAGDLSEAFSFDKQKEYAPVSKDATAKEQQNCLFISTSFIYADHSESTMSDFYEKKGKISFVTFTF